MEAASVDEEAGGVFDDDGDFTEVADVGEGCGEGMLGGGFRADDFDEFDAVDGVEEVEADEAFGVGDDGCDLMDGDGGGVGGEDGIRAAAG
jgi:hypothetical protein